MSSEETCINPQCGKKITSRELKLNAGLCTDCFQDACRGYRKGPLGGNLPSPVHEQVAFLAEQPDITGGVGFTDMPGNDVMKLQRVSK